MPFGYCCKLRANIEEIGLTRPDSKQKMSMIRKDDNHTLQTNPWQNRGTYMSVHVLLNLLNKLRKRDKMRGLRG